MDNKYFKSDTVEIMRSQIRLANYNPRIIDEDGKRQLKRSIKKYGIVGGIVVNSATDNTIVGGHQKISILDELNKYPEKDYSLKVEIISVDEKTEKELNITLNNPNVGGQWDYDKMRELIPDIDYKSAGLTENDLDIIGVDYILKTEGENDIAEELNKLNKPVQDLHNEELRERQSERAEKVQHMKDVKAQVKENSQKTVEDMDAYIMLSFDTYQSKVDFMNRFGYRPDDKFIKGEVFGDMVERVME